MSNGYRDGTFALGLVVGGGIALNLFVWLDYKAQKQGDAVTQANGNADGNEIGSIWDGLIGTFVSPSDTFAQWIMAVFTIAVVFLVWKTLVATQQMALDTKRIGEAQVRAYVSITEARVMPVVEQDRIIWNLDVTFRNAGQSPARNIVAEASMWAAHTAVKSIIPDIAAGSSIERTLVVSQNPDDLQFSPNSDSRIAFPVSVTARFQDVFNKDDAATKEVASFFGSFTLMDGEINVLTPTGMDRYMERK